MGSEATVQTTSPARPASILDRGTLGRLVRLRGDETLVYRLPDEVKDSPVCGLEQSGDDGVVCRDPLQSPRRASSGCGKRAGLALLRQVTYSQFSLLSS